MSKKFKNIENDEEFKKFRLEDYLPSIPKREPIEKSSESGQEPTAETATIFPSLEEPDTSAVQAVVSDAIRKDEVREDDTAVSETETPMERTIARRISSKQRRLSLDEYRATYLQVPKITDRKPVFVSSEVRGKLDEIVRRLGGRGMSASGLIENLARLHIEAYREDI